MTFDKDNALDKMVDEFQNLQPQNNGRRGPGVGENVVLGGTELTCIYVDGDDKGMIASCRVFAEMWESGGVKQTSIGHGPFDYVRDADGIPFRGYF